tara:strand:+ start:146 stop:544 length:399 start_codon:yes stop_codon:yes gene_type:complete
MGCRLTLDLKGDSNTNTTTKTSPISKRKIVPITPEVDKVPIKHEQSCSPIKLSSKNASTQHDEEEKESKATNTSPQNVKIRKIKSKPPITTDDEEINGAESLRQCDKKRLEDKARLIAAWERGLPPRTTGER